MNKKNKPVALRYKHSAGGVVYKRVEGNLEVALISFKKGTVWGLPKGLIDKGELPEDTAFREVREETGLLARILKEIGLVSYWYYAKTENTRYKKSVRYFLMEYISGDTANHDDEVTEARWVPLNTAFEMLTFKSDLSILEKAKEMIAIADAESEAKIVKV